MTLSHSQPECTHCECVFEVSPVFYTCTFREEHVRCPVLGIGWAHEILHERVNRLLCWCDEVHSVQCWQRLSPLVYVLDHCKHESKLDFRVSRVKIKFCSDNFGRNTSFLSTQLNRVSKGSNAAKIGLHRHQGFNQQKTKLTGYPLGHNFRHLAATRYHPHAELVQNHYLPLSFHHPYHVV